jgi:outer membrane protein OmpA-like peptidoglycan-associated protein
MKLLINKTLVLSVLVLIFNLSLLYGQTTSVEEAEIKKATGEFHEFKYSAAIKRLTKIITADTANLNAKEMLAFSYKMTNNYPEALRWYEQLSKQRLLKPEWALNYAEQLAINQQYEKSESWYRKYLTLIPTDQRAKNFATTKQSSFEKSTGFWKVGYTNLNTLGSEYSPVFYKNGLMFSSNRQSGRYIKHTFEWDNTPFTNLFVVKSLTSVRSINPDSIGQASTLLKKQGKINDDDTAPTSNDTKTLGQFAAGKVHLNSSSFPRDADFAKLLSGKIKSKYHNSSAAVFPDGSILFTRNNFIKGQTQKSTDGIVKLKLYTASGDNLQQITEFPYNSNEYSTGHPALNKEGNILIFASDMSGGYGGTDLYYSVRSGNGPWTRPVNLGKKINTEGNELFPYLDNLDHLYFASTGHAGLGGLDLFEVPLEEMKPTALPKNMGAPINSSKDDFGLIIRNDGRGGYFSSNRKGTDDIFSFDRSTNMILLKGIVYDAVTKIPLRNTRIVMRHLDGVDTLKTGSSGSYQKVLQKDIEYELTAQKIGYVNKASFISPLGSEGDVTLKNDIYLNRTETAQQYVLDHCDSLKKIFKVRNIYYDLDRSEIRADARPALNELAYLLRKYPEIAIITSSHTDGRATETYNRALSLRRGESAKAYLVSRGISPARITIEYYGKTRLVNRCYEGIPCSEENQQLNRRTEFDVVVNGVNLTQLNCDDK